VVDGGRRRRLAGAPPGPGPAEALGGDIIEEVSQVAAGELLDIIRPLIGFGVPLEVRKHYPVVLQAAGGAVQPLAGGKESADQVA